MPPRGVATFRLFNSTAIRASDKPWAFNSVMTGSSSIALWLGVSPVLFDDPVQRVVATLYPNHSWKKVVFNPWRQEISDVSDTVLIADPNTDADVGGLCCLPDADYLPTWVRAAFGRALGRRNKTPAAKRRSMPIPPLSPIPTRLDAPSSTVAHNNQVQRHAPGRAAGRGSSSHLRHPQPP